MTGSPYPNTKGYTGEVHIHRFDQKGECDRCGYNLTPALINKINRVNHALSSEGDNKK